MSQWQKDLQTFALAMWKHWIWWIASTVGSAVGTLYQARGHMIPSWLLWGFALSGIIVAAFLAHRDQCHLTEAVKKELEGEIAEKELEIADGERVIQTLRDKWRKLEEQQCNLAISSLFPYGTGRTTRYELSVFNEGPSTAEGVEIRLETVTFFPLGKPPETKPVHRNFINSETSRNVADILRDTESHWYFLRFNDAITYMELVRNAPQPPVWEFNTERPFSVPAYDPCQSDKYEVLISVNARNAPVKRQVRLRLTLSKDHEISIEKIDDKA